MSAPLTFLFTDIEGSSQLWDTDADSMRMAHRQHHAILKDAIESNGGSVLKDLGDGFMAVFNEPANALLAAAAGQRSLEAADWSMLPRQLRVRMGVHTGPAEDRDGDYFGPEVNIAARLESLANGGQILLSDATNALTARALSGDLATRDLGRHRLKGIGLAERVHQLVGEGLHSEFPPLVGNALGEKLPDYAGDLFGRDTDLENVVEMLRNGCRLVTLLGPGGIGKTRLAVEAARRLTDQSAAYFADMAPIRAASEIGPTFADALGIHVEGTADPFDLVADRITEPTVAVMDNLEHLNQVGPSISRLLAASPPITVIATSRSPLRIRDEKVYPVAPLAVGLNGSSAAVDLFYDRAAAQGVTLTESDRPSVLALCQRVDGLPLAIELIAAQTRLLSVPELETMLQQSLDAIGTGGEDRPDRHRTIRDTIEWSLGGLSDRQRSIFAQLSVFPAGANLDQLAFIREEPKSQLLEDLAALTDNSLVNPQTGLAGGTRFRQLALLREYGTELAAESGADDETMGRLIDYYVAKAPEMQTGLFSDNKIGRELESDHANLVAAMQWSLDHDRIAEMAGFLADIWIYWFNGDRTETSADFIRRAEGKVDSAKFEFFAGFILGFQMGDFEAGAVRLSKAEQMFKQAGDSYWVAMSRMWRGTAEPDPEVAQELLASAYEELSRYEDQPGIKPLALLFQSWFDSQSGDFERALERRTQASEIALEIEHPELMAWLPWNVGVTLTFMERLDDALDQLPAGFEYMADEGYQEGIASFGHLIGVIAVKKGAIQGGIEMIGACDAVMERIGVAVWGEVEILRVQAIEQAKSELSSEEVDSMLASARDTGIVELSESVRAMLADLSQSGQ